MLSLKRNGAPFLWNGCAVLAEYAAAVLVNAIFIMCAVITLSLQQWQNFGIAVFVLAVSCMILKLWDIIEYAIGVICGHLFEILSV